MTINWGASRIMPPMNFGDLDIDTRTGLLSGATVRQQPCANYSGNMKHPAVIVIHFTTSIGMARQVITEMGSAGVSSHLVIDRGGEIWQAVAFNRVAKHAGAGTWGGFQNNINECSIGIEVNNLGPLWMTEDYKFIDSYGVEQADRDLEPLPHRNARILDLKTVLGDAYDKIVKKGVSKEKLNLFCYWERFPEPQQRALQRVCSALLTFYPSIRAIIGHDDYAPLRKFDPGPALRMEKLVGWMPNARVIIPPSDPHRRGYMESREPAEFMRNWVASRTFGGGVTGRDVS